jgi:hypothetical protein
MPNIIAAQFDDFAHAEAALRDLAASSSIEKGDMDHVVLGAPGRHDRYPVGGDEDADARAKKGDNGALTGAAIGGAAGAATGIAAAALLGHVGAAATVAAGAYSGSLAGALDRMGESKTEGAPAPRPAGVMVMVHVRTPEHRALALNTFHKNDARSVEEADGKWQGGTWRDFNPVATPRWLVPPATRQ